jgi:hypothetical protein
MEQFKQKNCIYHDDANNDGDPAEGRWEGKNVVDEVEATLLVRARRRAAGSILGKAKLVKKL